MIQGVVHYSTGSLIGSTSLGITLSSVDRPMYAVVNDIGLQFTTPFSASGSLSVVVYAGTVMICDNRDPEASQIAAVIHVIAQCDVAIVAQNGISLTVDKYP